MARRVVTASADSSAGTAADAGPAAEMQLRRVALEASSVAQARVAEAWVARRPQGVARRPQGVARRGVRSSDADSWAGTAADAGPAAAQGVVRRVVTASADSSAGTAADAGPAAVGTGQVAAGSAHEVSAHARHRAAGRASGGSAKRSASPFDLSRMICPTRNMPSVTDSLIREAAGSARPTTSCGAGNGAVVALNRCCMAFIRALFSSASFAFQALPRTFSRSWLLRPAGTNGRRSLQNSW
eukprot:scaffold41846_cov57-Phaeocystis_antarctica.AAC.1